MFRWDGRKATANFRKHGVSFRDGAKAFKDQNAVHWIDDREDYGEDRWRLVGMSENRLLFVVYTERRATIRIISARKAEPHEEEYYFRRETPP